MSKEFYTTTLMPFQQFLFSSLVLCQDLVQVKMRFAQFEAEWRSVPPERMRSSCGICSFGVDLIHSVSAL